MKDFFLDIDVIYVRHYIPILVVISLNDEKTQLKWAHGQWLACRNNGFSLNACGFHDFMHDSGSGSKLQSQISE